MKRVLLSILIFVFIGSIGFAEPCPLPCPTNTHSDIVFQGFEWYTDYPTTFAAAKAKGLSDTWYMDWFSDDMCTTPHWKTLLNSISGFAGSETKCGGHISYYSDVPNVAGYKVDSLDLYFMWNEKTGYTTDYKKPGAVQFYMAKYELDVEDHAACYNDLVEKLKSIYGDSPYTDEYGIFTTYYSLWINDKGAIVGTSYSESENYLVYMAPGAEYKLVSIENLVKEQEIENAKGDISGL